MTRECDREVPRWKSHDRPWPQRPFVGMNVADRRRFFRVALVGAVVLVLVAAFGVAATGWLLAERAGVRGAVGVSLAALTGLAVAFLLVAAAVTIRGGAGPLRAIMDAADRVAEGDYAVRVRESGAPPVRALARAFNAMAERLAHADRQRRDLMADVAHELRTPLTVVQGRLEGLIDGVYPRDDQQLAVLVEETQVLSRLIEDLRTLALADAGMLRLEREPTDLVALVRDTVRGFEPEAARHRVTLAVRATGAASPDDAPADPVLVLDLDPVRIRQVLSNLLSNAVRHTPAGRGITVSVESTPSRAAVAVADAGEGMAPEDVPLIFDRFYKGQASRGSGLGLTIAKRLVLAHDGQIEAASRPGAGTVVTFTLPR